MAESEDLLDRAITAIVTRVSGPVVTALAFLIYAGPGLALPLALNWSVVALVEANVLGTMFAGLLALGWLTVRSQARDRRHLIEWTSNLRLLTAEEFEWLVGELFRREGWKVRETGRQDGPDGNVDLELTSNGTRKLVQCKRWRAQLVGVDEIRKLGGTLMREGVQGDAGIFVTLSDFGEQARSEAEALGIKLLNNRDLYAWVEKSRRKEPCPECQAPMVLDRSPRGWWFRCVAPGCDGKRDLGNDVGRAVEHLTQPS